MHACSIPRSICGISAGGGSVASSGSVAGRGSVSMSVQLVVAVGSQAVN